MKDPIRLLYLLLTRGLLLSSILFVLTLWGVLDPLWAHLDKEDLKRNAVSWASDVIALDIPRNTVMIEGDTSITSMQGDGHREVILQITPNDAQDFLTQIQQAPEWKIDPSTCLTDDNNDCINHSKACYRLDKKLGHDGQADATFCPGTGKLELYVTWT